MRFSVLIPGCPCFSRGGQCGRRSPISGAKSPGTPTEDPAGLQPRGLQIRQETGFGGVCTDLPPGPGGLSEGTGCPRCALRFQVPRARDAGAGRAGPQEDREACASCRTPGGSQAAPEVAPGLTWATRRKNSDRVRTPAPQPAGLHPARHRRPLSAPSAGPARVCEGPGQAELKPAPAPASPLGPKCEGAH